MLHRFHQTISIRTRCYCDCLLQTWPAAVGEGRSTELDSGQYTSSQVANQTTREEDTRCREPSWKHRHHRRYSHCDCKSRKQNWRGPERMRRIKKQGSESALEWRRTNTTKKTWVTHGNPGFCCCVCERMRGNDNSNISSSISSSISSIRSNINNTHRHTHISNNNNDITTAVEAAAEAADGRRRRRSGKRRRRKIFRGLQ